MIEFRAERPIWNDSLDLYAKETRGGKVYAVTATGIEIKEAKGGEPWPKFLELPLMMDAGQSLFDALWSAGFRPNKGEASSAHVEAMKYHLEDMRKLVFKHGGEDD